MGPVPALPIALGALFLTSGCYNLPRADPGPRWIDQFSGDAGVPTWNVFGVWTCGTEPVRNPAPGSDGGAVAGSAEATLAQADAGDAAIADAGGVGAMRTACQLGPGVSGGRGLVQPFAFDDTSNDVEFSASTQSVSGVDFTGFGQFVFAANLTTSSTAPLPMGTVFQVELDCSNNRGETSLTQGVDITINAQGWNTFRLDLSRFQSKYASSNSSCLSQIDEIFFEVQPGRNDQPEVAGTLSLDNISLQN